MVDLIGTNIRESDDSYSGYVMTARARSSGVEKDLDVPLCIISAFNNSSKRTNWPKMVNRISSIRLAVAGVTNSLNKAFDDEKSDRYYHENSVLKSFGVQGNDIDDIITGYLESPAEYAKYHTIFMERDIPGDDSSIHAYIYTPEFGKMKCEFDESLILESRQNNVTYWVDKYTIETDQNGNKIVKPELKG